MRTFDEFLKEIDASLYEEAKKKNWIQGAVKNPGRCTPAPNPDCPEGSPQYNLAMRFKGKAKKGNINKSKKKS